MLDEARRFEASAASNSVPLTLGVSARIGPLPRWKQEADALFVQVSFSVPDLVRWRERIDFDGPVYVGVIAPPSATMARKLAADIPQLAAPSALIQALESDRDAGVNFAYEMVTEVRESGVFEGVHLIPCRDTESSLLSSIPSDRTNRHRR